MMFPIKDRNWKRFRKARVCTLFDTSANLSRSYSFKNSKLRWTKFIFQNADKFFRSINRCLPDREDNLGVKEGEEGARKYEDDFDFR